MNLKLTLFFAMIFSQYSLAALTPAEYCKTLAATSCEVLNITPTGSVTDAGGNGNGGLIIKYCRNRELYFAPMHTASSSSAVRWAITDIPNHSTGGATQIAAGFSSSSYGSNSQVSNTQLCGMLP